MTIVIASSCDQDTCDAEGKEEYMKEVRAWLGWQNLLRFIRSLCILGSYATWDICIWRVKKSQDESQDSTTEAHPFLCIRTNVKRGQGFNCMIPDAILTSLPYITLYAICCFLMPDLNFWSFRKLHYWLSQLFFVSTKIISYIVKQLEVDNVVYLL